MNVSRKYHLHNGKTGAAITVRITPRSSRNQIFEVLNDGTIKIRLTAASEQEVNHVLVKFLAEILGVKTTKVEIVAGEQGWDKLVSILDVDAETVQKRILTAIN
jgi:uncharacterized protein (TIGR00251 family)